LISAFKYFLQQQHVAELESQFFSSLKRLDQTTEEPGNILSEFSQLVGKLTVFCGNVSFQLDGKIKFCWGEVISQHPALKRDFPIKSYEKVTFLRVGRYEIFRSGGNPGSYLLVS
jgi:hypothetical protein